MNINKSSINMSSEHRLQNVLQTEENLQAWVDPPVSSSTGDTVTISNQDQWPKETDKTASVQQDEDILASDPKYLILKGLIEAITGKEIRLASMHKITNESPAVPSRGADSNSSGSEAPRAGWGVRYEYRETRTESESTSFSAQGVVETSDGREIAFNLNLMMDRTFTEQTGITLRAGDAARIDPLVINFNGKGAQLTDQTFRFDLNMDNSDEQIPFVAQGSGFLVFDRNADGIVNNGSELFGPSTGNGFSELAQLDSDGNGWIDENDSDYSNLQVWTQDASGNTEINSLNQIGIGALSLSYISSPFDLKDQNNATKGQIIRTGIYLSDDEQAGTIQQLDLMA
jgi:hypothetical protein